jgi:hypothetical protein
MLNYSMLLCNIKDFFCFILLVRDRPYRYEAIPTAAVVAGLRAFNCLLPGLMIALYHCL